MLINFPTNAEASLTWGWEQYQPYFQTLQAQPLASDNLAAWLQAWTSLHSLLYEVEQRLYVRYSRDTSNTADTASYYQFIETISPAAEDAHNTLRKKLLDSQLADTLPELAVPLRNVRGDVALFRSANLPLLVEHRKLESEFEQILGAQQVEWQGIRYTPTQLQPFLYETDRSKRAAVWQAISQRRLEDRERINNLWQRALPVRQQLAQNADLATYRDYAWQNYHRWDYTPSDCEQFHAAIADVFVPLAQALYRKRQQQLGLDSLRPWDLDVDPSQLPALRPFQNGSELAAGGSRIFNQLDPVLGDYFDTMARENLLDLDNVLGKAPGAYCTDYPLAKRPFIFMNAVGLADDVDTLLHESGHAFHSFATLNNQPYHLQWNVPIEFAEVASMSMELLASPFLLKEQGGFFEPEQLARHQREHFSGIVLFLPYMAIVDSFQHWAYNHLAEAKDPAQCDAKWLSLWQTFRPGIDWSGLEAECSVGWQRKHHIHTHPFYYVEYGLAQVGALQVWRNAQTNPAQALAAYRHALTLGSTRSLSELFAAAGARLSFDKATLVPLADLLAEKLLALGAL